MRLAIPKIWQEAGLDTRETAELSRIFTADSWSLPSVVELDGERLLWRAAKGEEKRFHPGRGLMEDFVRLHESSPDQIVKYAKRWGVLGLCSHGLPTSHSYPSYVFGYKGMTHICRPAPSKSMRGYFEEPLEIWRDFSKNAFELLHIAAQLHKGKPVGSKDWEFACSVFAVSSTTDTHAEKMKMQRYQVAFVVERWLSLGGVRPRFTWEGLTPSFELGGPALIGTGLFGALAVQLLLSISRIDGLEVCSGCTHPYLPSRRPQSGRRHYCPDCREKGVPQLHAVRDKRERDKGSQK